MGKKNEISALKKRVSRALMQRRSVASVGVERDENGEYVLTVDLLEDDPELPSEVEGHAIRYVRRGPYRKQ